MTALRHDASYYREPGTDFADRYAPFLAEGLDTGEAVLAVTSTPNLAALRRALGPGAGGIELIDSVHWFEKPVATVQAYHRRFVETLARGHSRVRVIGEVRFGSTPADHARWIHYEALLNHAFADLPAWIVCPYREDDLPATIVASAEATHDHLFHHGARTPCAADFAPHQVEGVGVATPRTPPTIDAALPEAPARFRAMVRRAVVAGHRSSEVVDDAVLVGAELAANVDDHGGGWGRFRLWVPARGRIVGVVDDRGPGLDPWSGYRPPDPTFPSGRGLWLVRQLCHEVTIDSTPAGTRVAFEL